MDLTAIRLAGVKSRISGMVSKQSTNISEDHPNRDEILKFCAGIPNIIVTHTSEGIEIRHP